ncbi:MAG: Ig-like domain repeat protein, partial [Janthinobacterium lividum]
MTCASRTGSRRLLSTFAKWLSPGAIFVLVILILSFQSAQTQAITNLPGTTAVGASTTAVLVVTFQTAGTVAEFVPVTSGNTGGDFALGSGGSCTTSQQYAVGAQCTAAITFSPLYAGPRTGALVAKNSSGAVLGVGLVTGRATGSLAMFVPGTVETFAGQGDWIYTGDGGPATDSPIFTPRGVALDFQGNTFLADTGNNRVRRVDWQTGAMTTIAGTGSASYSGDGGPATAAEIDAPAGIALDGAGNLYFADELNNVIRRIDAASQVITTVAGTGRTRGYAGDGGPATSAQLNRPLGVSFDLRGNLLIADSGNHVIRVVDATSGTIRTLAGTGTAGYNGDNRSAASAQLNAPASTLALPNGTILVSDTNNNRIRRIDASGQITTIAGNGAAQFQGDGSSAMAASLKAPIGLAVDPAGNLYIADSGNNRIRLIAPDTQQISTIMGTDSEGFSGDDGPANLASMYSPYSLFFAQDGTLYVSDFFHMRIRGIVTNLLKLTYPTIRRGKVSAPKPATLVNRGNSPLTLSSFVFDMSALDSTTTSCNQTTPIATLQTCQLGVEFAPTVVGQDVIGTLRIPTNLPRITPTVRLDGEVLDVNPTSVAVVSSTNPSILGRAVTFTATVTSDDAGRTGNVTLTSDGASLCTVPLRSDGTISCTTSSLTLGSHAVVAQYAGDPQNAAATSGTLTQVVKQPTTLRLTSSSNPVTVTAPLTLTVVASSATGTPTGSVTFLDGTTTLGTAVLASGQASFTTSSLVPGTHNLSVQYGGDTSDAPGQSNVLAQQVQQASTTTMLGANNSSPLVGTPVSFTANVSSSNGPLPTGTVQFKDGSTVIGTAALNTTGTASVSTSSLTPGSHAIVAVYEGDVDDATSSSAPLALTVQQIGTSIAASASSNPLSAGATLHLSSQVSVAPGTAAQGPITGTVIFREGSTTYDTVPLDANQQAATDIRNLPVGTHLINVLYSGNTNYASSNTALNVIVNQTGASIGLSDASATTLAGGTATWTAAVSSNTGIPTGTVSFRDGTATLGSGTLDTHGVATFSTTSLAVGSHIVTAVYGGDANYTNATSAAVTHTVNRAVPALTLNGPASTTVNVTSDVTFSVAL